MSGMANAARVYGALTREERATLLSLVYELGVRAAPLTLGISKVTLDVALGGGALRGDTLGRLREAIGGRN